MNSFWKDVQYALRVFLKSPGFTAVAVLTLALGIGANAAIFSLVHAILLKPLPFRDPARLVAIWDTYVPQFPTIGISPPEIQALQKQTDLFAQTAWYRYVPENLDLVTPASEALEIHAAVAPPALFSVLGVTGFPKNADPHSVLLSGKLWRSRFHADPAIAGKTIHLNGEPFTVSGVLPPNFEFPDWADLWLPPGPILGDELTNPVRHAAGFIARLRPGVTDRQAALRLHAIARRLAAEHPKTSSGFGIRMVGLQDDLTANLRPTLLLLLGAVALVLLIACGNIANLLLSRASARSREIAIRAAIGAGRWRIFRQLLTESVVLALLGGALGLLLAKWSLSILLPARASLDSTVFLLCACISVASGIFFGLAPAVQLFRVGQTLSSSMRGAAGGTRTRGMLVIFEFALAIMLVTGAGVLAKSFLRLMQVAPGFNPKGVLALKLFVPPSHNPQNLFTRLQNRIAALPGVQSVATVNSLPLIATRANWARFKIPGSPLINPDALPGAAFIAASPDYFRAMQIPLLSGRLFTQGDLNTPRVIVNQTLARRFWPNRNPVGEKFITGPWGPNPSWSTIVGVVANVKQFGLDSEPTFDIYFPVIAPNFLVVKTAGNPLSIASAVRQEIRFVDSDIAISSVHSMDEIAAQSARTRRETMAVLAAFAALALLLAAVGIYGVISSMVVQRTREIGIRIALGATTGEILRTVVRDGVKLSAAGIVIGLLGALAFRRVLAKFVFGVSTADPLIYASVIALMLVIALLACYLPARQASRVDPLTALRHE